MTRPTVRLGYHGSATMARNLVCDAASRLDSEVVLIEYDVADPFRLLRTGRLDLMVAKFLLREPDLERGATLCTDARAVVVGAGHPLAGRSAVRLEDLADLDGFARPGTMPAYVWDEIVPPTTPSGRPLRRTHQLSSTAAMLSLVRAGAGVHLSLASLAEVAPAGVRLVPVVDLPAAPVFLVWSRDRVTDQARAFAAAAEAGPPRTAGTPAGGPR